METIRISKKECYSVNSGEYKVVAGKKYRACIRAQGISGERYSAYLAIILLSAAGRELDRKIRWLNDFSGKLLDYSLTAKAPAGSAKAVIAYRINTEIAIESEWAGALTEVGELTLDETEGSSPEDFDNILDAHAARASANARPLTSKEEDAIERNMAWVLGSPRSGSSWLVLKLLKRENIIAWNEPLVGAHLGNLVALAFNDECLTKIGRTMDVYAGEPDYFFSSIYRQAWMPYFRKMVLQRLYCQYPECLHKMVAIKEPNGSVAADMIMHLFPNSKLLFLVRDGRDVIESVLDMFRKESWANKWMEFPVLTDEVRKIVIIRQSNIWNYLLAVTKSAYEFHSREKRLMIKYEELRYNTLAKLKEIYGLLGVPADEEELQGLIDSSSFERIPDDEKGEGKVIRKAKPGSWKETFTEEEKKIMNCIMGKTLKEFGYEV
ncbi:MAG: sulfotransferase domain-containing protein [Nitrospiraceae bacterium]|nr:sulfotransferase domain-containing protein [Nitrospiraceae bacterium]